MHPLLRQLYIAHLNNYRHVYIFMSIHKRPILLKEEENQRSLAQQGCCKVGNKTEPFVRRNG
jgi:hypothetical protein